jgi:predicted transport protein
MSQFNIGSKAFVAGEDLEAYRRVKLSAGSGSQVEYADAGEDFIGVTAAKASQNVREIFEELREKIFELDENITEKATSLYVAYRITKNFAEIHIGKNQLKIHMRPIEYNDPENKVEKIPEGYNWTMDRRVYLKSQQDLDYIFQLIEQSYKDVL